MAIANGTCVSFCISLRHIIWLPHESHAGGCRHLATSRESKAHFGLPCVRPWDNRGKCYMDGKRIQCLSNASQHVPSIFNRFPVIQPISSKLRHFWQIFASPGYAPGTIAVNITWIDREFNAGQTPRSTYTHLSSTISEI